VRAPWCALALTLQLLCCSTVTPALGWPAHKPQLRRQHKQPQQQQQQQQPQPADALLGLLAASAAQPLTTLAAFQSFNASLPLPLPLRRNGEQGVRAAGLLATACERCGR
jgi:hypothetical protein